MSTPDGHEIFYFIHELINFLRFHKVSSGIFGKFGFEFGLETSVLVLNTLNLKSLVSVLNVFSEILSPDISVRTHGRKIGLIVSVAQRRKISIVSSLGISQCEKGKKIKNLSSIVTGAVKLKVFDIMFRNV